MSCGVPQESVLGPFLWNLAYDTTLRAALSPDCHVSYYADDTLVLTERKNWEDAVATSNLVVTCVVRAIKALDLCVSPSNDASCLLPRWHSWSATGCPGSCGQNGVSP